ncbi:TatD family hydrolase [Bartonella sp. HY761]|uniref:TatD family hydrolase n=1 Tax=Bartonella sp. HY761 TaxID=2979330 RepID=UPI0022000E21|nr:TatD family hydrolase [Bartonella sp. HY761]UXN07247.1 TatD family hydrolase [Bartonella sp. HY761]
MLIDSHCHLDFDDFVPELDEVVERAHQAGVKRMVTISTHVRQFDRIIRIAEKYEHVFCSVGTHPNSAHEEPDITAEDLLALTSHEKVVAIGEAGLDYHYDYATPQQQRTSFLHHIDAARRSELPLVIHSRNADEDMEEILREEMAKGKFKFILHCYSSGMQLAKAGIELGGYLSFSGILTFKGAPEIREVAKIVPLQQLLVETDAPYLAPVPYRGKRNEPSYVVKTAEVLAELRSLSYEDLAKITTDNAFRLFSKMQ